MRSVKAMFAAAARRLGPGALCLLVMTAPAVAGREEALKKLNGDDSVKGTEQSKSYRVLFDAYLQLSPPPFPISNTFNLLTIHPKMPDWSRVSDWAESNPHMAEAILACHDRVILGLPYGGSEVESKYREAQLVADIIVVDDLEANEFRYLDAMEVISAFATAEMYRLLEADQVQQALELAVAHNWVLRQLCDRQFLDEKFYGIGMLIDALSNMRDVFYTYLDSITDEQFRQIAWYDVPELRPDRNRLHIPEGDKVVSEAVLEEVFDRNSRADPEKFADVFAAVQSANAPLTRFGAARRWRMIAAVHGSLDASKERLDLIYHDWWRRWRVQAYDAILETDTQFERTNPIRYAAVIYSMQDIASVFELRNQLVAAVNGTAVSAGLCGYKKRFGVYPDDKEKLYALFVRKNISDVDPYDRAYGNLQYRFVTKRESVDTLGGRVWIDADQGLLYSRGQNNKDDRGTQHAETGDGDIVLWPPIRALSREQGLFK